MQALESSRNSADRGSTASPLAEAAEDDLRLEAIRAGDRQAFERLCHEYYGPLAHFLSLVLPTLPTRDLCEEVFAEVWASPRPCPPDVTTLVLGIGLRQAATLHSGHTGPVESDTHSTLSCTSPKREQYRDKLGELPWEQRVVAALVYGMSLSLQSIAQITAMSEQEIIGHLSAARLQLRT
jgi:DNA-directed RNA polymerase specialized sigma24 family protein